MKKFLASAVLCGLTAAAFAQGLPPLAVMEFTYNVSTEKAKADSVTVRNMVESQLAATRKYDVMTREKIDLLLKNQQIAMSDISSPENLGKLKLANVSYIVTGSVDALGSDYVVTVNMFDVLNGHLSHTASDFISGGSRELYTGVNTLIANFVRGMSLVGGQVVQNSAGAGRKTYRIGDTGPGGGIIFAIEGNTGMEVSPLLGDYAWSGAINAAGSYRGGGFSDWHLPSSSELTLIYENLQKAGIVNLGSGFWSSAEYNGNIAWFQRFSDGAWGHSYKNTALSVRAVRVFNR
jgi:TolB-like protein